MIKNSNPAGSPKVRGFGRDDQGAAAGPPDRHEDFGQFEPLTPKLVPVSKKQVDEARPKGS